MIIVKRIKPTFFLRKNVISISLLPLALLYLMFFYAIYYLKKFFSKQQAYQSFVIGICDFVAGGTGKTPISLAISKFIQNNFNKKVCFIYKNYVGRMNGNTVVIPHDYGVIENPDKVGEEAIMLSRYADVFVVKKRNKIDSQLERYDYAICDGGLVDFSIKINKKIGIIDSNYFIGNGFVLPAGPLRMPIKDACRLLDYIIITDYKDQTDQWKIKKLLQYIDSGKILTAKLKVTSVHNTNASYLAYAGIGNNDKFFQTLIDYGIKISQTMNFEDHYLYKTKDFENIISNAKLRNLKIITTTKDYIKIPEEYANIIEKFNIEYEINDIEKIFSDITIQSL